MAITVRTGAALKSLFGGVQELQAEGATVGEILNDLGVTDRLCDASGQVRRHFNIHINEGEDIRLLQGPDTPVKDGDTLNILSAIAGGSETSRRVWITFPKELVGRPLVWEVGQKFKVVTNVRQASVSHNIGLVGLELSGEADEIAKAIEFLTEAGASVEPIEMGVVE